MDTMISRKAESSLCAETLGRCCMTLASSLTSISSETSQLTMESMMAVALSFHLPLLRKVLLQAADVARAPPLQESFSVCFATLWCRCTAERVFVSGASQPSGVAPLWTDLL